jgi:hypothetical protein
MKNCARLLSLAAALALLAPAVRAETRAEVLHADLLIVGGNESACAAAIQASRLGVRRIVLVNDIDWLGGQFSAEGVGCLDEWITVNGKRVNFPRSGLFLEMIRRIRAHNSAAYGKACPGNAFCGTDTIEPKAAADIFQSWLAEEAARVIVLSGWEPVEAIRNESGALGAVRFQRTDPSGRDGGDLTVRARLTLDSSDWGDVIRLSGAGHMAGPDLKSQFGEPSAPDTLDEAGPQEMNPVSYCVVLRETGGVDATVPRPATYDARSFTSLDRLPPWRDSDMSAGIYSPSGNSPYTHRRLVDRWNNGFEPGTEATFINYPVQDYPLCQLPGRVRRALEELEPGASRKNIVDLTPAQRRVIFEDAKQHALGVLHHLQTAAHDRVGDFPQSFRYMRLTDEFGTPDRLPPKPYVREGLRLVALDILREQDILATGPEPMWAKYLPLDSVFAFQFNIDFHPTRRRYLTGDEDGPWQFIHTKERNWHTDTDRAVFPMRGLIPARMDGLLGCGKNLGVTSIVQSALRLHGQMMHAGQAAATLAWMSLRENNPPRALAADWRAVREIQLRLVRGAGGPGLLLWPWQDLDPDDLHFEAANMLAVRGILRPDPDDVFFRPGRTVARRELARWIHAALHAIGQARPTGDDPQEAAPLYEDVATRDPDRAAIEFMVTAGDFAPLASRFRPDDPVTWGTLASWLRRLDLPASEGLTDRDERAAMPLSRAEAAIHLWRVIRLRGEPEQPWAPPVSRPD